MHISCSFFLLLTLALFTSVILTPLDKGDNGNGQKEQTENIDKQVEEMRKKLLAWSDRVKKRREEEEMHHLDDSDHSETSHFDQPPQKKGNKQKLALLESRHDRGGCDVDVQEAAGSSRQSAATNRLGYLRSKSDENVRRNEFHEIGQRQIVQYSKEPPCQIGSSKDHHIPRHSKKTVQSIRSTAGHGKQIVVHTDKPIIQKRQEKSMDDLQTLQKQMNALMAQNAENKKGMREEAEALQAAHNVVPPRNAIQPKFDGFLDKVTRKMTPEPDNWKKGLTNMLKADVQHKRRDWRDQNVYEHDYLWCITSGERCQKINCPGDPHPERTNEQPPENPEKASGIAIDDKPDQNYLLKYENTKTLDKMQSSDASDDEVAVNSTSESDQEKENFGQHLSSSSRRGIDQPYHGSRRVDRVSSRSDNYFDQIDYYGSRNADHQDAPSIYQHGTTSSDHQNAKKSDQRLSRNSNFVRSRSDNYYKQRKPNRTGSRNAKRQDAPSEHHGTSSSDHQNAINLEQQDSLNPEDKFDEDEQLSRALKESVEEAESMAQLKHREDDQMVIAMQKSVQDEIERRQSSRKGKLKHKPSSSKRPTNNNSDDDDLVLQKAIQASLSDLR